MGLFDGYYDPSTYQGGGGMIDRLMAQLQTQSQYQPSQGFPGAPMNAQAAMPAQAPQNDPIAVGNYQMPRIGSGFAENTEPGSVLPRQSAAEQDAGQLPAPMRQQLPQQLQAPGDGLGDHITAGLMNLSHAGGILPALVNSITGFATGQRTDPQGLAQQNVRQTYQAMLAAGIPEPKARLAAINPEYGKAIMADALGKTYGFATLPDGTVIRQDPRSGTVEPVYSGGAKPTFGVINEDDGKKTYGWIDPNKRSVTPIKEPGATEDRGTVNGPDGKPIPIPPGVDRKTFVNEVSRANAKAAAGELTEAQAKATIYASKMELAEKNLKGLDDQYTSTVGAGGYMRGTEYIPGVGNSMQSDNYQKYKQARDNFITALLRQESGAAIGTSEFNRYEKELFPQPGDGAAVVQQKREARRVAIEGMKKGAGPGYKSPSEASATGGAKADPLGIR